MHRNILAAVASAALALPTLAGAATYEIDAAHSSAQFAVKHMMVSTVRGTFSKVTGTINLDDKNPTRSTVEATIDATSVDTGEPKRDEHLKSPDFFDTAKFPTLTFKSTKVEPAGAGQYKVTGDLTLHGVTKQVVLNVESSEQEIKDPWGNTKRGATATTKISRKDFGLTWNKALESGGVVVGDDVSITIDAELAKKADAAVAPVKGTPAKTPAPKK